MLPDVVADYVDLASTIRVSPAINPADLDERARGDRRSPAAARGMRGRPYEELLPFDGLFAGSTGVLRGAVAHYLGILVACSRRLLRGRAALRRRGGARTTACERPSMPRGTDLKSVGWRSKTLRRRQPTCPGKHLENARQIAGDLSLQTGRSGAPAGCSKRDAVIGSRRCAENSAPRSWIQSFKKPFAGARSTTPRPELGETYADLLNGNPGACYPGRIQWPTKWLFDLFGRFPPGARGLVRVDIGVHVDHRDAGADRRGQRSVLWRALRLGDRRRDHQLRARRVRTAPDSPRRVRSPSPREDEGAAITDHYWAFEYGRGFVPSMWPTMLFGALFTDCDLRVSSAR